MLNMIIQLTFYKTKDRNELNAGYNCKNYFMVMWVLFWGIVKKCDRIIIFRKLSAENKSAS